MDRQTWKKPAGGHLTGSELTTQEDYNMAGSKMQENTVPVSAEEYRTLVEAATKLQAVTRMMETLWGELHAQAVIDQFNVITGFEVTIRGEEFEE